MGGTTSLAKSAKKPRNRSIEYLDPSWIWIYKEDGVAWTTSTGKTSYERHAYNTQTGQSISTRQAQNMQRATRALIGQPKSPTIRRVGKTKTIKAATLQRNLPEDENLRSIYDPEIHGDVQSIPFRSFEDAKTFVANDQLPEGYTMALINIKFRKSLKNEYKTKDKKTGKMVNSFYANILSFTDIDLLTAGAKTTSKVIKGTTIINPWWQAYSNMENFDMSGNNTRVYITVFER